MKRRYIIFLAGLGLIVPLWFFASITNTFQSFRVPSGSNFPTIKPGDRVYGSNLKKPHRFDLITFYSTTPQFGRQIWTQRLCGMEGDTLEIRSGDLYINGKYADSGLTLAHYYKLPITQHQKLKEFLTDEELQEISAGQDSLVANLADSDIKKYSLAAKRVVLDNHKEDEGITATYHKDWNQDFFGPIVIPKDKYFLLGDNRLNSQDSRYLGFIDKKDYSTTILNRK